MRIGTHTRCANSNDVGGRKRGLLLAFFVLLGVCACNRDDQAAQATVPATQVAAVTAQGSAKLSWIPPTSNSDGSKLTGLAGYKIYYGTSPQYLQRTIDIKDPSVTEYTIENLPPYTYYFVITAYTADGTESSRSNIVSKTVR